MNSMIGIVAFAVFIWAATYKMPKKQLRKKEFNSAKDCWVKGWGFETKLMFLYVLIFVSGLTLAAMMMGGFGTFIKECTPRNDLDKATGFFLIGILILWPTVLIVGRRTICHHFEKEWDEHLERRKKYGIKLIGEDYAGQYRTPKDNPVLNPKLKRSET